MWTQTSTADLIFTPLGANTSLGGWVDNTVYDFTLTYQQDQIRIDIKGGTGSLASGATIFDIALAAVDPTGTVFGGAFPDGRFGFYNLSQASVRYQGFTQEADPVLATIPANGQSLSFGAVRVGSSVTNNIQISNAGGTGAGMLIGTVQSGTGSFSGPATALFELDEGQSTDKTFAFSPAQRGNYQQNILIDSNAPQNPNATVGLSGIGVGPVFDSSLTQLRHFAR